MASAKAAPAPPPGKAATPAVAPTGTPQAGAPPGAPGAVSPDGQPQDPEQEVPKPNFKTMAVVEYLGLVDKLLKQGLEIMIVERPENPIHFLSTFLDANDTHKKPPQFFRGGPPPPKTTCQCRRYKCRPMLPPTSCGCFHEPGWEPNPEFPPIGWPELTSVEFVQAMDTIALP